MATNKKSTSTASKKKAATKKMTTSVPTKLVVDCATGEQVIAELTQQEIDERQALADQFAAEESAREAERQAKAEAKASAEAKLAALGLTAEEIAALAG